MSPYGDTLKPLNRYIGVYNKVKFILVVARNQTERERESEKDYIVFIKRERSNTSFSRIYIYI